jgi:hypothetical protein
MMTKTVVLFDKSTGQPCGCIHGDQDAIDANLGSQKGYIETNRTDIENFYIDVSTQKIIDKSARPSPAHEWSWLDKSWITTAESVRTERDRLLKESDWTQGLDVPEDIRRPWAEYRAKLRDISQTLGFPSTVQWPKQP